MAALERAATVEVRDYKLGGTPPLNPTRRIELEGQQQHFFYGDVSAPNPEGGAYLGNVLLVASDALHVLVFDNEANKFKTVGSLKPHQVGAEGVTVQTAGQPSRRINVVPRV